jgi:hypothetical protein
MPDVEQYLPAAGAITAVAIWLRQYWFQQRLTNDNLQRLRLDNEALRKENRRLNRENTVLRSRVDEVDLELLAALEHEGD